MKQFLLATALIALPVIGFTSFQLYQSRANAASAPAASLGDLSSLGIIITDVQTIAATGDLTSAKARIKDFEIAWDQSKKGLKPLEPAHWGRIDEAADAAFTAVRATTPDAAAVKETLAALLASLSDNT